MATTFQAEPSATSATTCSDRAAQATVELPTIRPPSMVSDASGTTVAAPAGIGRPAPANSQPASMPVSATGTGAA